MEIKKVGIKEYLEAEKKKDRTGNKYRTRKITFDGITFDSTREGEYYLELKDRLNRGEFRRFICQMSVELIPPFPFIDGGKKRSLGKTLWYPDFVIFHHDRTIEVIDVKAKQDKHGKSITKLPEFRLKIKMMKWRYRREDSITWTIIEK